jgi:hypothetical protein
MYFNITFLSLGYLLLYSSVRWMSMWESGEQEAVWKEYRMIHKLSGILYYGINAIPIFNLFLTHFNKLTIYCQNVFFILIICWINSLLGDIFWFKIQLQVWNFWALFQLDFFKNLNGLVRYSMMSYVLKIMNKSEKLPCLILKKSVFMIALVML